MTEIDYNTVAPIYNLYLQSLGNYFFISLGLFYFYLNEVALLSDTGMSFSYIKDGFNTYPRYIEVGYLFVMIKYIILG